jgi:hypothetical protein
MVIGQHICHPDKDLGLQECVINSGIGKASTEVPIHHVSSSVNLVLNFFTPTYPKHNQAGQSKRIQIFQHSGG